MPNDITTAWCLNPQERQHALNRIQRDQAGTQEYGDDGEALPDANKVVVRDITDVLKDWRKILIVVFNILGVLPVNTFTTSLPFMVEGMGYAGIKATLMTVPPFLVGATVLMFIVWSSDHFRDRSGHLVGGMLLAMIGCIVMATSTDPRLRYGFTNVAMAGVFVSGPIAAAWLACNTSLKVIIYPARR